jgi:nitronate monooxygenase
MNAQSNPLVAKLGLQYPVICGAMYPCSNPELVAAVSAAGGLGVVQPLSLTYVHRHDMREGMRLISKLANGKPWGFNVLTEQSSKTYQDRMRKWVDIALEEGCRFFITALGNPKWIVERVRPMGGLVYHDVTERKWAEKALAAGVDGLIAVNSRAGGHAGTKTPEELFRDLSPLGVPLVCAGGIGTPEDAVRMLKLGYVGIQMGSRFIATTECTAHDDYKQAILKATADDIVLTEKLTGVPVAIIRTPTVDKVGTKAGPIAKFMLRHNRLKHYMRLYYSLKSFYTLKHASMKGMSYTDYWQAGKSVDGIESIEPAGEIVRRFGAAWMQA